MRGARLILPLPPAAPELWRREPGRAPVKSPAYRAWLQEAAWAIRRCGPPALTGQVALEISLGPGAGRRALEGCAEPVIEALAAAGRITGPSAVMELRARRGRSEEAGGVEVSFRPFRTESSPAPPPRPPLLGEIVQEVCARFGLERAHLLSPRRARALAWPRQLAFLLACELTSRSLPEIARHFRRDHTSVLYGRDRAAARVESDPGWARAYEELRARLTRMPDVSGQLSDAGCRMSECGGKREMEMNPFCGCFDGDGEEDPPRGSGQLTSPI